MSQSLRIASFNCENLFHRTKVLNLKDEQQSSNYLNLIEQLQALLDQPNYTEAVNRDIFDLSGQLTGYIDFRVDHGSLGVWQKDKKTGKSGFQIYKKCRGRESWTGQMILLDEPFHDQQCLNTARVIRDTKADVICLVEVEGMNTVHQFNKTALKNMYSQFISVESPNDPRGINVACLSKYPILQIKTHIFDDYGEFHPIFSRDCLEVKLDLGAHKVLNILCNHFKSQRAYSKEEELKAAAKRKAQAERVVEIVKGYNLESELVAVTGDLNEDTTSAYHSLDPLLHCNNLKPLIDPSLSIKERYTYYYAGGTASEKLSQLDYILLSKPLSEKIKTNGFIRGGIYGIDKTTAEIGAEPVQVYDTVTGWDLSASDHAAIWGEFEL